MNDTDVIPQGTLITAALQFTTFYDLGVPTFYANDFAPYVSVIDMSSPSVVLTSTGGFGSGNFGLGAAVEEIDITGAVDRDITVGNLRAQVLQAVINYNGDHLLNLKTPSVVIGQGPASPLPAPSTIPDVTKLVGSFSTLGIVILLGVGVWFALKVIPR